jgi:hypothetical protein
MRLEELQILTPVLTPAKARLVVVASWSDDEDSSPLPWLSGRVIGPLCEYSQTLTDRFPLEPTIEQAGKSRSPLLAAADIWEPCFWEPKHPFCYEISLELHLGDRIADMRRVNCGIRHLQVIRNELLLNGQPFFMQGVRHSAGSSIAQLEAWHDAACEAFLTDASNGLCERTDRWGPMVLHYLVPGQVGQAQRQVVQLRNHPSLVMWVLPPGPRDDALYLFSEAIRKLDPSRPIGRMVGMDEFVGVHESTHSLGPVDVLFLPYKHPDILKSQPDKPYVIVGGGPEGAGCTPDSFVQRSAELRDSIGSPPGLVGVML